MRRALKWLAIGLGALLGIALILVLGIAVFFSPTYANRTLVWQDSDVQDYTRFPSRPVQAASVPYRFAEPVDLALTGAQVEAILKDAPQTEGNLDGFLADTRTQALIVISDGEVWYERYVNGFARDSIATSFSTAKSFVSALVGIAISEGAIHGIDDPITDYLPELLDRDERFGDITIPHLLNLVSGIHYVETGLPNGDDALTYYFDDLEQLALERTTIDGPPGETWLYNNYHPILLGIILTRTTGMPVTEYLQQKLWQPMGAEFDASWSLDSEDGLEKLESGINARPIDFAKLGQLYLDRGVAQDGTQIVPADWVALSTTPTTGIDRARYYPDVMDQPFGQVSHQMLWWHVARADGLTAFSAEGNKGQFIFVAPSERVIVARFGEVYGIDTWEWLDFFIRIARELPSKGAISG